HSGSALVGLVRRIHRRRAGGGRRGAGWIGAVVPSPRSERAGAVVMSSLHIESAAVARRRGRGFRSELVADRVLRRLLGVADIDRRSVECAHRAFRTAVVVSGSRCLITYLAIPVLVPVLRLSGWFGAPIGIALCVVAIVNGTVAVRRFWISDHRYRWMYTVFMGVVFLILAIALYSEIHRWVVIT